MDFLNSFFINKTNIYHLGILDIIFIAFFFKIRERFLNSMFGVFVFYFFGTFLHEMAHFLVALVLRAKPVMPFLLPRRNPDGSITLGRVEVLAPKWWNVLPIAIAPLSLLIIAYFVQKYYFSYVSFSIITMILYLYILIVLIDSSIPSLQDFKMGYNIFGIILWAGLGFIVYANKELWLQPQILHISIF